MTQPKKQQTPSTTKITKKDTDSDVLSVTSSIPSYTTEELPMYSTNTVQPNLPPLYEENDNSALNDNDELEIEQHRDEENLFPSTSTVQRYEYKTEFHEASILFLLFSVEYKTAVVVNQ